MKYLTLALTLLNTICIYFTMSHTKTIATVDITGMTKSYVKTIAKAELPPETAQKALSQFSSNLQDALITLSTKKHLILLPTQAVVGGAPDMTQDVVNLINTKSAKA